MEVSDENARKKSDVTVNQSTQKSSTDILPPIQENLKVLKSEEPSSNNENFERSQPEIKQATEHHPTRETPNRSSNVTPRRESGSKVEPIVTRPFQHQLASPRDIHYPPPLHPLREMYYQHLLSNSNPLLPYFPLYQSSYQQSPQSSPEVNLSFLRLPTSPGPLPPSPNYLTAEYIARNFSFNRNQL